MDKSLLVQAILSQLRAKFEERQSASKRTRAGGNDAESKSEGKYDTRSIEENYLADGLARHAQVAAQAAAAYDDFEIRDFASGEPIDLGALAEIEFATGREWFFLGPAAGGLEVESEGHLVIVLTPESPLGVALLGRKAGESITSPKAKIRTVR